jgi:hypothetical protein
VLCWWAQLLMALDHLHSAHIAHRRGRMPESEGAHEGCLPGQLLGEGALPAPCLNAAAAEEGRQGACCYASVAHVQASHVHSPPLEPACNRLCNTAPSGRDVKPANVFLSSNRRALKLGDLGVAKALGGPGGLALTLAGTPGACCAAGGNGLVRGADRWRSWLGEASRGARPVVWHAWTRYHIVSLVQSNSPRSTAFSGGARVAIKTATRP